MVTDNFWLRIRRMRRLKRIAEMTRDETQIGRTDTRFARQTEAALSARNDPWTV